MKALVLSKNLKEGVGIVSRLSQKSISLPILNNILLETDKNFLKFSSTDLEIGIKYWVLAKIEEEGKITIPGKIFANFISSVSEEKINLEIRKNILHIEGTNFQSKILGQSAEDYPLIPEIKEGVIDIGGDDFIQALAQVVDVTASTQIRPELAGVFLFINREKILMAASDSFRLAEKILKPKKESNIEGEHSFILPQKTARELVGMLGDKEVKLKIYFSANQVMFETEMPETQHPHIQLTSRLIEGSFPNYKEIIPQKFQAQIVLNREEFLEQSRVASLFAGKINEVQLTVLPQKNQVEIFAQNPDLGDNTSSVSAKIEGEKMKVSFNYRFLIDGLLKIKTNQVSFQLSGEESPALLKPLGDDSFLYVVMPIKPS